MKKMIAVMSGLAMMMTVASTVYADFGFATEPDEVAAVVQAYIDEKLPGKAVIEISEAGEVIVKINKTSFLNPNQQVNILTENLRSYLLSNDADYSIVRVVYDEEATQPAEPTEPAEPEKPAEPTEPTEPEKPAEPTQPAEPAEPTEPAESAEPEKPEEPEKPTESTEPVEPENPAEPAKTIKLGDLDSSGTIDVTDLTEVSLALLGDRNLTDDQLKAADVDGDGTLSLADLAKLRQYLSKKIDSLD